MDDKFMLVDIKREKQKQPLTEYDFDLRLVHLI